MGPNATPPAAAAAPPFAMLRAAVSRLRAHLHPHPHAHHHHGLPSVTPAPLRSLSTRWGKRSSPTASPPADSDDEGSPRGLSLLPRDPERPPRLLVVQPRLRPGSLLDSKLAEALNLANSLEEPRDGFYKEGLAAKGAPPHLVAQNPSSRGRSHVGMWQSFVHFQRLTQAGVYLIVIVFRRFRSFLHAGMRYAAIFI